PRAATAQPIDASEPLTERTGRAALGDHRLEIEVRARLDALGGNHDDGLCSRRLFSPCEHAFANSQDQLRLVERAHAPRDEDAVARRIGPLVEQGPRAACGVDTIHDHGYGPAALFEELEIGRA